MRILFFAEAVTLAHVARPLTLIDIAADKGWECYLACAEYFDSLIPKSGPFTRLAVSSIPRERFTRALQQGTPIYDLATLQRYVEEDCRLIELVKPDVVVGDFRVSLSVSARLAKVPYITITNGYWSPYAQRRFPIPDLPPTRIFGPAIGQAIFDLVRPWVFKLHAAPLDALRRAHGYSDFAGDLCRAYTDADLTLLADLPELAPPLLPEKPAHTEFLGPILWSPPTELPDWWHQVPGDRSAIYVNLGSSGRSSRLPAVVDALSDLGRTVVVGGIKSATASLLSRQSVFSAEFLPSDAMVTRSSIMVCNGGSPSTTQALSAGIPVLMLPGNLDQFMNAALLAQKGLGLLLRANASSDEIRSAARALMDDAEYRIRAEDIAAKIKRFPVHENFFGAMARMTGKSTLPHSA